MLTFELVVPCYNEANSLPTFFERALKGARAYGLSPQNFQLVLVDNGSTDDTATVLTDLAAGKDGAYLKSVYLPQNAGYGGGVWHGLQATESAIIGWTHADGQCDPQDAFRAWAVARKAGAPVLVKGQRIGRQPGEWLFTRVFEIAATVLLRRYLTEINAQPKVFHRSLLAKLDVPPTDFTFDLYVTLKAHEVGWPVQTILVYPALREHGSSHWSASLRSRLRATAAFLRFLWNYQRT